MLEKIRPKKKRELEIASTENVTLSDAEMEHLGKRWHSKYLKNSTEASFIALHLAPAQI